MMRLRCFKAYDVRARVPELLNEEIAYRIGRALAEFLSARTVVVGRDLRHSGLALEAAFCRGIVDAGADAHCLGTCGTEEVYFATAHSGADGGAMVTASHNPVCDNGIKMVAREAQPIGMESGLSEIRSIAENGNWRTGSARGAILTCDYRDAYIERLCSFIEGKPLAPLRIVTNAGHSGAGLIVDLLEPLLPFEFVKINHVPDGRFPKGVPNPMLEAYRFETGEAVRASGADMGIAWDGDFDRCFFFDESGTFVESYYLVGLLAEYFLSDSAAAAPGAVVHDARLVWNTQEIVAGLGATAVCSKAGHSFVKQLMRSADAVYGGEMSAHHYFRDFFYCDSGMVPWLVLAQLLVASGKPLSSLWSERARAFPVSGELNCKVDGNVEPLLRELESRYSRGALSVTHIDGLSVSFVDWRFNVRASNTEALLRLNVETRANPGLLEEKTRELMVALGNDAQ